MNRASVSKQGPGGPRPIGTERTARAVMAREAGLELTRPMNRWLITGAVGAAGLFSLLAAHAFHGHTTSDASSSLASQSRSSSAAPSSSQAPSNAGGSGLQAPTQAPSPTPAAPAPVVSGGS